MPGVHKKNALGGEPVILMFPATAPPGMKRCMTFILDMKLWHYGKRRLFKKSNILKK